jgi:hypothetical protein
VITAKIINISSFIALTSRFVLSFQIQNKYRAHNARVKEQCSNGKAEQGLQKFVE